MRALDSLEKNTRSCSADPAHRFPSHVLNCPWCEITKNGGPNYFITVHVNSQGPQNTSQFWTTICRITLLVSTGHQADQISLIACQPSLLPAPDKTLRPQFVFGILIISVAAIVMCAAFLLSGHYGLLSLGVGIHRRRHDIYRSL